jgi:hypothetical protein
MLLLFGASNPGGRMTKFMEGGHIVHGKTPLFTSVRNLIGSTFTDMQ